MLIPSDRERAAVEMFLAAGPEPNDIDMQRIHRAIWPEGKASVSLSTLRTLLRSMAAAFDDEDPSDDLPEAVDAAIEDVERARKRCMGEIEADVTEGGTNPARYMALAKLVDMQLKASKHRMELQLHRAALDADRRRRRGSSTGRAS